MALLIVKYTLNKHYVSWQRF